jgi:hypothetical protein
MYLALEDEIQRNQEEERVVRQFKMAPNETLLDVWETGGHTTTSFFHVYFKVSF